MTTTKTRNSRKPLHRHRPENCYDDAVRTAAVRMFADGFGYKRTAHALGISVETVRDWRRRYEKGKFRERLAIANHEFDQEARDIAWFLYKVKGWPVAQICEHIGASRSTLYMWFRKRAADEQKTAKPISGV